MTTPAYDADKDPGCLADRDRPRRCADCGEQVGLPGATEKRCGPCRRLHAQFIQA